MIHAPSPMLIGVIILLFIVLFGPSRLPEAAKSLGLASKEFKKGLKDDPEPEPERPALKGDGETSTSH